MKNNYLINNVKNTTLLGEYMLLQSLWGLPLGSAMINIHLFTDYSAFDCDIKDSILVTKPDFICTYNISLMLCTNI